MPTASLFDLPLSTGPFLTLRYAGPSFEGRMDLGALARELAGVDAALRTALAALARQKHTTVDPERVRFVVDAFEPHPAVQQLRLLDGDAEQSPEAYGLGIQLAALLTGLLAYVQGRHPIEIANLSPRLQAEIADVVKVELLRDPVFIHGIAAVTAPLTHPHDTLTLTVPGRVPTSLSPADKDSLAWIAEQSREPVLREAAEDLLGKITRVDLDAYNNHLGLKVDGTGDTIKCTLLAALSQGQKASLLGHWVRITGTTSFQDDVRKKIDVTAIALTEPPAQQAINLRA